MNPSQQAPLDYLNQIAPSAPKKGPFKLNLRTVLIGGGVLVALVVVISLFMSTTGGSTKKSWSTLAARIAVSQQVADDSSTKIKNSQLKSTNSDLKLYLTNTTRSLSDVYKAQNIDIAKLPKDIVAAENGDAIKARLEDARLNAKYDSSYAREMSYHLSTLLTLYQQLYQSSSKADTRQALNAAYDSLEPIQQKLATFSAANE